jgi:hypothetical protein
LGCCGPIRAWRYEKKVSMQRRWTIFGCGSIASMRAPLAVRGRRTLELIRDHPGVRAGDLCGKVKMEMQPFKVNVRKLKALGLTESLEIGYRLSARGRAWLARLA